MGKLGPDTSRRVPSTHRPPRSVTVTLSAIIAASTNGGSSAPLDALVYGIAVGFGTVPLLRRGWHVAALILSVLGVFVCPGPEPPAVSVAVPVAAALFPAPPGHRLGKVVRFNKADVMAWAEGRKTA